MVRKADQRVRRKYGADGKRTDRVKKAERERMLRMHDKGKTIEAVALELGRSTRTVSKQLEKAKVLQANQKDHDLSKSDPAITKRKEEHFGFMAEIAKAMLANGLDDVLPCPTEAKALLQLGETLNANAEAASDVYSNYDLECFGCHLEGENRKIQAMGVSKAHDEIPYNVIETLRVVARRKTFKGTCPVCEGWQ